MKNKSVKSSERIYLAELQISPFCKKIIDWVRHVRIIYWILAIVVLLVLFFLFKPDFVLDFLWPRIKAQPILVSLIFVFCTITISLVWKTGQRIDVWAFTVFNYHGQRPQWADWIMLGLTQLGSSFFAFGLALIYFLLNDRLLAYEIIVGTLTLWLVVELMKMLIRRRRPYIKIKNIRIIGSRAGGHSFPSGHTSQAFYMATLLLHYYKGGLIEALGLYTLALLIGMTRIYVGMHYPRDVLGGSILGTAWGLIGLIVNSYIR